MQFPLHEAHLQGKAESDFPSAGLHNNKDSPDNLLADFRQRAVRATRNGVDVRTVGMTGQCPCTAPKPREKPFRLYHIGPCLNIHPLSNCISLGKALSGMSGMGGKEKQEGKGGRRRRGGGREAWGWADVRGRETKEPVPLVPRGRALSQKRKDGGYLLSRWTQYHRRGRA